MLFVLAFLKFLQLYDVMLVIGCAVMSNYFLLVSSIFHKYKNREN